VSLIPHSFLRFLFLFLPPLVFPSALLRSFIFFAWILILFVCKGPILAVHISICLKYNPCIVIVLHSDYHNDMSR
jgi:hypothetical protein